MNEWLDWLGHFIDGMRRNQILKVMVFCWCLGFFLKKWRWFSANKLIPLFVIPIGAWFSVMTDHHHTPDLTLDQERWDNFGIGLFISTAAWVSHRVVWKKLDKIPVVGKYLDTGNSDPKAFIRGQNAEVDAKALLDSKQSKPLDK